MISIGNEQLRRGCYDSRMRVLSVLVLLGVVAAGCDCPADCERQYRECVDDPDISMIQCDIGYDQCLDSCNAALGVAPDGG